VYSSYDNSSLVKIISLLKSQKLEYLSGVDLSESLCLSRAAIWKQIKKLQSLGYKIDSKPKVGYKLLKKTKLLLPWEITDGLKTTLFGKNIYYFDTIDSTQDFALGISSRKQENGTVVISQKQTHGRGRLNRRWASPRGGIWLSLIIRPEFELSAITLFPIITALALAIAVEKVLKIKPEIKWPNDLTLADKKIAGILVDASLESNKIDYLVIGVGINFKIDPTEVERVIKRTVNYGVTTLVGTNNKTEPVKLVQAFLFELERFCDILLKNNTKYIIKEWTKRSSTIGQVITVSTSCGKIKGKAIRLDSDGALVISNKDKVERIFVGDVIDT